MNSVQLDICERLWRVYFPRDKFHPNDKRVSAVSMFLHFLLTEGRQFIIDADIRHQDFIIIDTNKLADSLPFEDLKATLKVRPYEVIGCMGMAIGIIANSQSGHRKSSVIPICPRFVNIGPPTSFGDLRSSSIGQLVCLRGYVVRITACRPLVEECIFKCSKCLEETTTRFEDGMFVPPTQCSTDKCRNKYLDLQRHSAITTDYQRLKIQEGTDDDSTGDTDTARIPRSFEVEARGSLVDVCVSGDLVEIVGTVKAMQTETPRWTARGRGGGRESGLHQLYLHANSITRVKSGDSGGQIASCGSSDDCSATLPSSLPSRISIASRGGVGLLVASLCPSIFGQELVKFGLLLSLFGGTSRPEVDGPRTRSDVHVLVVGDPGLGKSQLLRATSAVAHRSVYVCANTATAAGLTVSVTRENRGEMVIEAGALVLADRGVCCIDELDKMTCDSHALLEAMEQQQISIAKSGVVTALKSRTAVIAAANPVGGHYNRKKSVCENLKMAAALLSRFDLVFVLLDRPDEGRDRLVSEHIMRMHKGAAAGPSQRYGSQADSDMDSVTLTQRLRRLSGGQDPLPTALLRQYVAHARETCRPSLSAAAAKVLQRLYLSMRAQASSGGAIPVTTRHLESLIRLAQARAKLELRDEVTESDARDVADLLQEALLDANTNETGVLDTGRRGGMSMAKQVKALVQALNREADMKGSNMFAKADIQTLSARLGVGSSGIVDLDGVLDVMRTEGFLLLRGPKLFQLQTR